LKISAAQLVYANVDKEHSPKGRPGYQTLFYTKAALSEDDVDCIEGRLLYYPPSENHFKRVFFGIPSGKIVLARLAPLAGKDSAGRGGRYMAHALIVEMADATKSDADLLSLFSEFQFLDTLDDALKKGDFSEGDIQAESVELSPAGQGAPNLAQVRPDQLAGLLLLGAKVEQLKAESKTVGLTGTGEEILKALKIMTAAVPAELKAECSFDDFFHKCNLVATYFWAVGLPEIPANNLKFIPIDAAELKFAGTPLQPSTIYEKWIDFVVQEGALVKISEEKETAHEVCKWLDGTISEHSLSDEESVSVFIDLLNADKQSTMKFALKKLENCFPPLLAELILPHILERLSKGEMYKELRKGFDSSEKTLDLLYAHLAASSDIPGGKVINEVEELLKKFQHQGLMLLYCAWKNKTKELREILEKMGESEYREALKPLVRIKKIKPWILVVAGHADAFIAAYQKNGLAMPMPPLKLVEMLAEIEAPEAAKALENQVKGWPGGQLKKIAKIIEKNPGFPSSFSGAVERRLEDISKNGIVAKIKGLFRKK